MGVPSQPGLARHSAFVPLLKSEFEFGESGEIGEIGGIGRVVKHGAVKSHHGVHGVHGEFTEKGRCTSWWNVVFSFLIFHPPNHLRHNFHSFSRNFLTL